ncbi:Fip1 motif-domain-containing protein [Limtongia smithiae]|uniref:Fip1 motif-domain-containing protein n=1 Tax=Limtongia smithiae TaxID=1125753 RepID=UPI0034CED212
MYEEDEDDEFLYGTSAKKQKLDDPDAKDEHLAEAESSNAPVTAEQPAVEADDRDAEEDEDDDEDSDIEFVIESKPGQEIETPAGKTMKVPGQQSKLTDSKPDGPKDEAKPAVGIELDKIPEINGTALTQMDLDSFEDKPWRKPGADITDYFNFGFDEFSWTTYCLRQDKLRDEYDSAKLTAHMMQQMQQIQQMQMQSPYMPQPPSDFFGSAYPQQQASAYGQSGATSAGVASSYGQQATPYNQGSASGSAGGGNGFSNQGNSYIGVNQGYYRY